jgi:hypothetical protein
MGIAARALGFILERSRLRHRLQAMWRRDIVRSLGAANVRTRKSLKKLTRRLEDRRASQHAAGVLRHVDPRLAQSDALVRELDTRLAALERVMILDGQQARLVDHWYRCFAAADVCRHAARAVFDAPETAIPGVIVVDRLFPPDFYELLLASLPPAELFEARGATNMNLSLERCGVVPRLTRVLWEWMDTEVARAIADAAFQRLRPFVRARYEGLFGREWAETVLALPHGPSDGHLMLRRSGYQEKPHLDPKQSPVTVLIHLVAPGDSEAGGTALYTIDGHFASVRSCAEYPEAHGLSCRLVSQVPFESNSALIFVNDGVAHAIGIPPSATSPGSSRYAFQFHVGPTVAELLDFVATLPVAAQQEWLSLAASGTA